MKKIILCADDFGQNKSICQGIVTLLREKKLSATSCMTNRPHWPEAARALKELNGEFSAGLHFNLTLGPSLSGLSFLPLQKLMMSAFLGRIDKNKIAEELKRQLDAFEKYYGRLPDHIDGHQHVHHLPHIRDALLEVYNEYFPDKKTLIRVSIHPFLKNICQPKRLVITLTGALALKKHLERLGIPHNTSFSGSYDFSPAVDYEKWFQQFLNEVDDGGWIMCHPANGPLDVTDEIAAARQREFDYFSRGSNSSAAICSGVMRPA